MPTHTTSETLVWNGRKYRVAGLKWGQEFSGGLPDVIAGSSGYSTWGGSCEITPDYETFQGGPSPWGDAYPSPGDTITISVTVDDETVGVYRPVVEDISFTLGGASLEFIMPTDSFSRTLRLPPVMQTAPATIDPWGAQVFGVRYPAPTVLWTVAEAFRIAGYHLTPAVHASTVIDLSMQGCVWTNSWRALGETVQCESYPGSPVAFPRMYGGEGILWMHHGIVYAIPNSPLPGDGFRVSFLVNPRHRGEAELLLMCYPQKFFLRVTAAREIILQEGDDRIELLRVPADVWDGQMPVSLVVQAGAVSLSAGKHIATGNTGVTSAFTGVKIVAAENAGIAGVQVDNLAHGNSHRITAFTPNARIKGGLFTSYMRVCLPSVQDRPARTVLDEVAEATLASWWVDGDGTAHFEDANSLAGQSPAYELEPDDIGGYQITSDLLSARSAVEVIYSECSRSASSRQSVALWAGGGTASAGDVKEEFLKPDPTSEEWFEPDFTFSRIASDITGFNSREGSWWGASKNGATHDDPTVWAGGYSFTARQVTPWVLHITESFTEAANRQVYEHPDIWRSLRGGDTPILRGRGLVTRAENRVTLDGGKRNAPVLEIDAQKWVDRRDRAEEIAAFIMRYVADPPPLLKQVTLAYSPEIKLGQGIKINGYSSGGQKVLFGAVITCLITGFTHNPDAGETTLSLRVTQVEATAKTWREIEEATRRVGVTWEAAEKSITNRGVTWSLFGNSTQDYGG